jgi:hypothetical protein
VYRRWMKRRSVLLSAASLAAQGLLPAGCRKRSPPPPEWVAGRVLTTSNDIDALTVDETGLYFTCSRHMNSENVIRWAPLAGGHSKILARGGPERFNGPLGVDATYVYTAATGSKIFRFPRAGGALEVLVTDAHSASCLCLDETSVYFLAAANSNGSGAIVGKMPKQGGSIAVLSSFVRGHESLVLSPTHVYWTCEAGLFSVPRAGGPTKLEVDPTTLGMLEQLAVDATHLYFSVKPPRGGGYYWIYRRPLAGGPAQMLVKDVAADYPIHVFGGQLYYYDNKYGEGVLRKMPVAGGPPVVVGSGYMSWQFQPHPSGLYLYTPFEVIRVEL